MDKPLFNIDISQSVNKVRRSGKRLHLLTSTQSVASSWPLPTSKGHYLAQVDATEPGRWLQPGENADQLIYLSSSTAKIYSWSNLDCLGILTLNSFPSPFTILSETASLRHPRYFATIAKDPLTTKSSQRLLQLWDFKNIDSKLETVTFTHNLGALSFIIDTIVGVSNGRLVFMNTENWICSVDVESIDTNYVRHFFTIPNDWLRLVGHLTIDITRNGEIIVVKRAELLVIKCGLDMTDQGAYNFTPKRSVSPTKVIDKVIQTFISFVLHSRECHTSTIPYLYRCSFLTFDL